MSLSVASSDITRELAEFVRETSYQDLPQTALNASRRSLVNFLGASLGGSHHEEVESTLTAMKRLGIRGDVPVIGRSERVDGTAAAFLNGISSAVLDFDSTQMKRTNIHPAGPVLPAVLAFAHQHQTTGRDFIAASVLGMDVACRIANGIFGQANPGWHVTGVAGGIGSAAAVAKLLRLDIEKTIAAMAIAANQASGIREMYGTACKALTPGRAARDGILSAFLAAEGVSAPARPIEGRKGLAMVFTGREASSSLTHEFGEIYEIELNVVKPYPCAIVTHATIDGVSRLCEAHMLSHKDIAQIVLGVAPIALELAGHDEPQTELQSKFSLTHAAAVAATHRGARVEHFSEKAVKDADLVALRKAVHVKTRKGLRKNEAYVLIRTVSGDEHRVHVQHALGSLEHPMSDDDIAAKFRALAEPVLGPDHARRLLDRAVHLEESPDAGSLPYSLS